MSYKTIVIALLVAFIPSLVNAQDCDPEFASADQTVTIDGINIEPGAIATRSVQLRLRNRAPGAGSGGGRCPVTIRIARIAPPPGGDFPPYELRGPGNQQLEILPDRAAAGTPGSELSIANAPRGPQGRVVPIQIALPTEWGLRAGTYTDQLEVLLIDQAGNVEARKLTVTIVIPATASLRLVGAVVGGGPGGPAQVDLGTLSSSRPTQAENFGARIFSTEQYSVRLTSSNRGRLRHENADAQIAYKLFFDGRLADLEGGTEYAYSGPTPRLGDFRPMRIVVDPVFADAGNYADRITVTVTAM